MYSNSKAAENVDEDGDLYSGYDLGASGAESAIAIPTSAYRGGTRAGYFPQTARGDPNKRPMTSKKGAGYSSRGRPTTSAAFDPLNQARNMKAAAGNEEVDEEESFKRLESKIFDLIEDSAKTGQDGKLFEALEKAKEAAKKERLLTKRQEQAGQSDQLNLDLTYSVLLNLAYHYEKCGLYQESINAYTVIVKNKAFSQAGRLRVNMGNIYFIQGKHSQAIKMYRMALDQIPAVNKNVRFKILRNIGNAFVKMAKYQDAVTAYESVMDNHPDYQTAFNLLICYFALGDKENMKRSFQKLVNVPSIVIEQYTDMETSKKDYVMDHEVFQQDALRQLAIDRKKKIERFVIISSKLIAPLIDLDFAQGYDWAIEVLRSSPLSEISSELEIAKAMHYLKVRDYQQAIETLKKYEKKDQKLVGTAATNISFLYFLEGEYKLAEKYAEIAVKADRYNAKAINNRANCFYVKKNYQKAIELYQEAIMADSLCIESIYNLGLAYKQKKDYQSSIEEFEKLNTMIRGNAEVIFQIADNYNELKNFEKCLEWLNILISLVPTDPFVLALIGEIYAKDNDKTQAFHFYNEAYRYFPSNLTILNWLGNYYVECEIYEKAIKFFEKAASMQPYDVKWQLIIASCLRRGGNIKASLEGYKTIHERFPENAECLKFIIRMTTDMGLSQEALEYKQKLSRIEKPVNEKEIRVNLGSANSDNTNKYSIPSSEENSRFETNNVKSYADDSRNIYHDDIPYDEQDITNMLPD